MRAQVSNEHPLLSRKTKKFSSLQWSIILVIYQSLRFQLFYAIWSTWPVPKQYFLCFWSMDSRYFIAWFSKRLAICKNGKRIACKYIHMHPIWDYTHTFTLHKIGSQKETDWEWSQTYVLGKTFRVSFLLQEKFVWDSFWTKSIFSAIQILSVM